MNLNATECPTIIYKNCIVALIDVMGFRKMLSGNEVSDTLKSFYEDTYGFLLAKGQIYDLDGKNDNFKKLFVSDSIVLSVELSDDIDTNVKIAARFFSAIALLQYILAVKTKIWTRGAVSVGNLFMDEQTNILVGPAFVQAFELEKTAEYPRVVVDPKLCAAFDMTPKNFIKQINSVEGYVGKLIPPNGPFRAFMDSMKHNAIQIDWFRHAYDRQEKLDSFFEDLKERLSSDQSLFQKSQMLLEYLRESVALQHNEFSKIGQKPPQRVMKIAERLIEFGYWSENS